VICEKDWSWTYSVHSTLPPKSVGNRTNASEASAKTMITFGSHVQSCAVTCDSPTIYLVARHAVIDWIMFYVLLLIIILTANFF